MQKEKDVIPDKFILILQKIVLYFAIYQIKGIGNMGQVHEPSNSQGYSYAGNAQGHQCKCGGNCGCKTDGAHECSCGGECDCK
ncbi:hypothetical protein [Marinilabilia salmonicolor]|uniref:hypothetical protein n=1 Tax=Marinilabilia salmonicolor TaxID=989 RepID=UPI00029A57F5|nr:hypothetical protein [Marinilabilia salmonicolor]